MEEKKVIHGETLPNLYKVYSVAVMMLMMLFFGQLPTPIPLPPLFYPLALNTEKMVSGRTS